MKYRPEIDGLRAIAVLPVIFFHGGFTFFQGGFIGVDVFFVISGYLITGIIITEIFQSSFSIVNFYERRARRILPALFMIFAFSVIASWILLPPIELKKFGQSLFSASVFASNFYFWLDSGYFDSGAFLKPLIHTWSLGVEEQFYIIFPLLAMLIYKLNRALTLPFFLLLFFISLSLAHIYSKSENDAFITHGSFFLFPTRAWELLLGSILFLAYSNNWIKINDINVNNLMSFIGLLLICYSIIFFSEATPFPSIYTLIPTIGTALLITFCREGTLINKILTIKPMILIGLISYSAYLWHQPLLIFSRHYLVGELSSIYVILLIFLTFLLSYLSWRFVEKPFRDKGKVSRNNIFLFSIIGSIFFGIIGLAFHFNDGYKNRYTADEVTLLDFNSYRERDELYRNRVCFLRSDLDENDFSDVCDKGNIYIWGDSYAASLSYGMRMLENTSQFTTSRCPPIINFEVYGRPHCQSINEHIFNSIKANSPKSVFLTANWLEQFYKDFELPLQNTLDALTSRYPLVNFYVLGTLPSWYPSLPNVIFKAGFALDGKERYLENQLFKQVRKGDLALNAIVENLDKNNLDFISLQDLLCIENKCLYQVSSPKIEPISFDHGHLTGSGSIYVSSLIFNHINMKDKEN